MIIPLFLIFIASTVISLVLSILTLGFSSFITTPATITFITLYGINVALEKLGKGDAIDLRVLITYSVAFGLLLTFLKFIGLHAVQYLALFATQQHLGLGFSRGDLQSVDEAVQFAFAFAGISYIAIFSLIVLSVVHALLAVPMAAAAHSSGQNATSVKFLEGIGTSFIPLFLVVAASLFLQFFFELIATFSLLFGSFVLQVVFLFQTATDLISQSGLKELVELFTLIDPIVALTFLVSVFAVLWLQAWIWAASALAFMEHNNALVKSSNTIRSAAPSQDLRELRRQRENNRN